MNKVIIALAVTACDLGTIQAEVLQGPYVDVTLTQPGTLKERVGSLLDGADYLVVRGPMNEADFASLREVYSASDCAAGPYIIDLTGATLTENVLPNGAFEGIADRLVKVILPEGIKLIGERAFRNCGATSVNIPSTALHILNDAFSESGIAGKVEFPAGTEEIYPGVLSGAHNLTEVVLHEGVKSIYDYAFANSGVQNVALPASVKHIYEGGFEGVQFKENPFGTDSPRDCKIDEGAFAESNISYIPFCAENQPIIAAYLTENNPCLERVVIPSNVVSIEKGAFRGDSRLREVVFETTEIVELRAEVFKGTSLLTIVLPSKMRFLGHESLADIPALASITSINPVPPVAEGAFGGLTPPDIPIYVPVGSAAAYRSAEGWKYFSNFVEVPGLTDDSSLSDTPFDGEVKVYAKDGCLRIEGVAPATRYTVYTTDGRMVSTGLAEQPAPLHNGAIYVVKVGGRGYKVAM